MGILDWRREMLYVTIAGMETCWLVGWSRVIFASSAQEGQGLAWLSVWALYVLALTTARILEPLELPREPWIIAGLALLSSLLLIQINFHADVGLLNLSWIGQRLNQTADQSVAREVLTLFLGFIVWFRGLRAPMRSTETRAMAQQFWIGVTIMVCLVLVAVPASADVLDLVVAYFALGLLAMALTRMSEIARRQPDGAAPFTIKWAAILGATLLIAGTAVLLAAQIITVEALRWALQPLVLLWNLFLFVLAVLIMAPAMLIIMLIQRLAGEQASLQLQSIMEELRRAIESLSPTEGAENTLDPQLIRVLRTGFIVGFFVLVLWIVVRAFRRWRLRRYGTPGAVREAIAPDGSLAQDLADFVEDRWQRLKELADVRRLFHRWGAESARAIYANLLALLAAADRPRLPEQTPYEYQPVAEEALRAHQAEVQAITEAYVRAHYGEQEIGAEELAGLQAAWKRIRTEGKRALKAPPADEAQE